MQRPVLYEKPQGVRDFIPHVAAHKRTIERKIMDSFHAWGYQEIITPTFEYQETFENGLRGEDDRVFRFIERSGRMVILRPDMTAPIARVVGSLLREEPLPLRLCYTAEIFRQQELVAGRDAEFSQAGIELIGEGHPDEDAETIALAIHTLKKLGVEGFQLAVGQVAFLRALLSEHVNDERTFERLQSLLTEKDFVGYEKCIKECDFNNAESANVLLQIPGLRGGIEVLERARSLTQRPAALAALDNLAEIWQVLQVYRLEDYVQIDLGLQLGLHYYTGAIFEGYAPMIGFPICGGGRYDNLLENFGRTAPATGFMIGIERVLEILERKGAYQPVERLLVSYDAADRTQAIAFTAFLREKGYAVCTQRESESKRQTIDIKRVRIASGDVVTDDHQLAEMYNDYRSMAP